MYTYLATVESVHDGDSVRLSVDLGFHVVLENRPFRLYGLDAPELDTPEGLLARAWLRARIFPTQEVTIRTHKDDTDKYGRYLVEIWDNDHGDVYGDSINTRMINAGHAKPWNGRGPRP